MPESDGPYCCYVDNAGRRCTARPTVRLHIGYYGSTDACDLHKGEIVGDDERVEYEEPLPEGGPRQRG